MEVDDGHETTWMLRDKVRCCSKYTAGGLIVGLSLCVPPLMIFASIAYQQCEDEYVDEDMWSLYLLIGALLWYLEVIAFSANWKINNRCTFALFSIISTFFSAWWVFGFIAESPARSILHGRTPLYLGVFEDTIFDSCKLFMYQIPFWIAMIPFLFLGVFFMFISAFACAYFVDCICV